MRLDKRSQVIKRRSKVSAANVRDGLWVEGRAFADVCDGSINAAFQTAYYATIDVGIGVISLQLNRSIKVGQGAIEITALPPKETRPVKAEGMVGFSSITFP